MGRLLQTLCFLLLITSCPCAVITGACERDPQCGSRTCSLTPSSLLHLSRVSPQVPFFGKRQHHTCPCLPNFICSRFLDGRYRCSVDFKNIDF
ncbi:PREDICTED: prokineticin-1 [Aptenodytes forsteri]|uniref:prokineticin-1 n=1 Tax=Aptenodytes forsteri TaxID=9233 RepID=UPI0004F41D56|nr:PREDICTED: prokineticin-1 [Aptenodytes forsteri]